MIIPLLIYIGIIAYFMLRCHSAYTSSDDYLFPRKQQGSLSLAMSYWATGESGWWIMGLTGAGYAIGLQAVWIVIGEIVFTSILWIFIAPRFYNKCESGNIKTLGDFFNLQFNDSLFLLRIITTGVLACVVPLYLSAQFACISRASEYFFHENATYCHDFPFCLAFYLCYHRRK